MNKELIVFSGGGDPSNEKYQKVYSLIENEALDRGYENVTITKWSGHLSKSADKTMTLSNSIPDAVEYLKEMEEKNVEYDLIARSFGCTVILKALEQIKVKNLKKIVLWGPPPFYEFYRLFAIEPEKGREEGLKKGTAIDPNFFSDFFPFEILFENYNLDIPLIVAYGTEDKYCSKDFVEFLSKIAKNKNIKCLEPIEGLIHEVTEPNDEYFRNLFD